MDLGSLARHRGLRLASQHPSAKEPPPESTQRGLLCLPGEHTYPTKHECIGVARLPPEASKLPSDSVMSG